MTAQHFNRWWLRTVLGLSLLQVAIAVITDPYCVFGVVRFPKRNFEPNTRFLKVEYLRRHPEYDAFILGSSRASFYGTDAAERFCGGGERYYNLNGSLENGAGIRRKIGWLTASRQVSRVIINVDFDLQSVFADPLDLLRQDHPLVTGSTYTAFYAKYLLFQPRILFQFLRGNLRESKGEPWNYGNANAPDPLYATGPLIDLGRLYDVTLGAASHDIRRDARDRDVASVLGHDEFRRTMETLDRGGVDRILIVPPYRLDQFAAFSIEALSDWLRKTVRAAGSIWDFAGYNAVTADPANYVDPVHFDRKTGDEVLRRACGAPDDAGLHPDFGTLLTESNLENHIAALRRQHERARQAIARNQWAAR